jgi:hypothetical protein
MSPDDENLKGAPFPTATKPPTARIVRRSKKPNPDGLGRKRMLKGMAENPVEVPKEVIKACGFIIEINHKTLTFTKGDQKFSNTYDTIHAIRIMRGRMLNDSTYARNIILRAHEAWLNKQLDKCCK